MNFADTRATGCRILELKHVCEFSWRYKHNSEIISHELCRDVISVNTHNFMIYYHYRVSPLYELIVGELFKQPCSQECAAVLLQMNRD
jgi:hypothetical protein